MRSTSTGGDIIVLCHIAVCRLLQQSHRCGGSTSTSTFHHTHTHLHAQKHRHIQTHQPHLTPFHLACLSKILCWLCLPNTRIPLECNFHFQSAFEVLHSCLLVSLALYQKKERKKSCTHNALAPHFLVWHLRPNEATRASL